MITHFAGLKLQTVSIEGAKQFYHGILGFPVRLERSGEIHFQLTEICELQFVETADPIAPVHIAFEVPFSAFDEMVNKLARTIPLLSWEDGTKINRFETGQNVYFRDGDGHLLELLAHSSVRPDDFKPFGALQVLYLREVGLPFESERLNEVRDWMRQSLMLLSKDESEQFGFMVGGTAHAVVVSTSRRWIPISMIALKPRLELTYGVSSMEYLEHVHRSLSGDCRLLGFGEGKLSFQMFGYIIHMTLNA